MSAVQLAGRERAHGTEKLSQATIFRFFSPLALSWIFMSVESPLSVALISRMPGPEVSTAAFEIMMGLALWIESPVIDLLATSTTLSRNRQNYVQISRFVWLMIGWVTIAHIALVFTPLYTWVTEQVMGVPTQVAQQARLGLAVMVPWAGFIGWRRYLQGILIRNGRTKLVGMGTVVRVSTMFLSAFLLYFFAHLPSVQIAGISLISAVGAEAIFAHVVTRSTIRKEFTTFGSGDEVSMKKLSHFHLPLTATTMVVMLATPLISTALARSPDSVAQLAGYQVAVTLIWLMRTTIYSLPEVVITLYRDEESAAALRKFCIRLGLIASGASAVIWGTGLDKLFFSKVLGATSLEISVAHLAFIAPVLTPLIGACQSYVRGMLTAHHLTVSRLFAVGVSISTLIACLVIAILLRVNGVLAAGISLTAAYLAELLVLTVAWRRRRTRKVG